MSRFLLPNLRQSLIGLLLLSTAPLTFSNPATDANLSIQGGAIVSGVEAGALTVVNKLQEIRDAEKADEITDRTAEGPSLPKLTEIETNLKDAIEKKEARKLTKIISDVNKGLYQEGLNISTNGPITKQILQGHALLGCPKGQGDTFNDIRDKLSIDGVPCEINPNGWVGSYSDMLLGRMLSKSTISPTGTERDAYLEIMSYLTEPFPAGDGKTALFKDITTEEGQQKFIRELMQQSTLSVARNSLYESYYMRLPPVANYAADNPDDPDPTSVVIPDPIKPGVQYADKSIMQVMDDESRRRLEGSDWRDSLATLSTEGLLKELLYMQAYQMRVEHIKFLQQERMEILLATIVGALAAAGAAEPVTPDQYPVEVGSDSN